jgi:endonuclease
MRLIVARCEVSYSGRLSTRLRDSVRLLMLKEDGTFMVWSDGGGPSVKPLNWMTPPTAIEVQGTPPERIVVRKRAGKTEDRVEVRLLDILSDVTHDMGESASLEKDGAERGLQ